MQYFKKFDFFGKNVAFFYGSSTIHRTIFGGLLSIFTFSLMATITIYSLYNFLYQKPVINSNVIFFINKKFAELKGMEINGDLTLDIPEDIINNYININNTYNQLDDFLKYYRIVLHEKYFDEIEKYHVAKITKLDNKTYHFNVEIHINDVFKEKEFSSLKIISCNELLKNEKNVLWPKSENIEGDDYNNNEIKENDFEKIDEFDNSPEMCLTENKKYFENVQRYNLENIDFIFSFDTPIYTVDRKGALHKTQHLTRLNFNVKQNYFYKYSMDLNYVVIEDDSNIYYTKKKYDAYFTMKHPVLTQEDNMINDDFNLNIDLTNDNNDQIILISINKYKLLDFLAKLGGIMKIITIMKMTCTFWSSYFYEKTLYKLIVKRNNPYLEQKRLLLEFSLRNISSKKNLSETKFDLETDSVRSQSSVNYNLALSNLNSNIGPFALPEKTTKKNVNDEYCSYFAWIMNKFCKFIYLNKEARRKKLMITDTLGLSNYLLHLDYIDRQIILEQKTGEINNKINKILSKANSDEDSKDDMFNLKMNLVSDKMRRIPDIDNEHFETKNKMKPLVEEEDQ